jgi:Mrp family chromosome partitioning ATPase
MSRLNDALEKARREGVRDEASAIERPRAVSTVPSVTALRFIDGAVLNPDLDSCLTELLSEDEPWAEQFRNLATRLRAMEGSEQVRRIGLMSAMGGEGKSTLALALSLILAEEQRDRVLLVDADLRRRALDDLLGNKPSSGLGDWLNKPHPHLETRQIGSRGPFFLSAGRPFARPWELIASPHLANVLDVAASEFRYVIVDCPAEGPVADAARIQEHLDGLLLVVRARTAPRDAILSTLERLDEDKMLGVIFNGEVGARKRFEHYRYSAYSETKHGPKTKKKKWRRDE